MSLRLRILVRANGTLEGVDTKQASPKRGLFSFWRAKQGPTPAAYWRCRKVAIEHLLKYYGSSYGTPVIPDSEPVL